ncbi:hypothetical protein ACLOJK_038735 [Asimina triloba]
MEKMGHRLSSLLWWVAATARRRHRAVRRPPLCCGLLEVAAHSFFAVLPPVRSSPWKTSLLTLLPARRRGREDRQRCAAATPFIATPLE